MVKVEPPILVAMRVREHVIPAPKPDAFRAHVEMTPADIRAYFEKHAPQARKERR